MRSVQLLTVALFVVVTVPRLAHQGMFVDGVTYASIARNLAEGRGQFWTPSYTATIYPEFHEHPPLGFWLQSLWFRLLGDHLFVERLYTFAAGCGSGLLIALLWRRISRGSDAFALEWLPVLLWTATPLVSWSIVGNLLETTVSVFTTAAVAAAVYGNFAATAGRAVLAGGAAGLFVVAAVLTKGPVGFFPLAAPVILSRLVADRRRWIVCLSAQWAMVALCGIGLLAFDASRSSLDQYVNQQVVAALSGQREVSGSSLTILKELGQGVLVPLLAAAALVVAAARRFERPSTTDRKRATAFLVLGLAGTLPILASAKQAGHYLVPAVPFYALATATIIGPTLQPVVRRLSARSLNLVSGALIVVAVVAAFVPAVGRDRVRMAELDRIERAVPRGATMGICAESNGDWGLHAWFQRRFTVSLDAVEGGRRPWFLATNEAPRICVPRSCEAVTEPSRTLVLLKCTPADPR